MNSISKKKLYIPFNVNFHTGGPQTFMSNLKTYLDNKDFPYTENPKDADVIFFPIEHDIAILKKIKKRKGKIIQRLDGVYYPSKHGEKYKTINRNIEKIYNDYADFIIFQNNYCRSQCLAMFGETEKNYEIIINGVNKKIFSPIETSPSINEKIYFVTTGNFRNIDMIEPLVRALDSLKDNFNFQLTVVGPVTNSNLKVFFRRDYVSHVGDVSLDQVADYLRKSHIFIYSHLNPPCPNSVLEAISVGLPIVGFDSGSMSELCWFSKDLLSNVSNDIFQKYEDFNPLTLAEKIELCVNNFDYYKKNALDHVHLYSFDECGKKYIEVFDKVLKNFSDSNKNMKYNLKMKNSRIQRYYNNMISNVFQLFISKIPDTIFSKIIIEGISKKSLTKNPSDALKFLFNLDDRLYLIEGKAAIRYGHGLHTKHKHTKYHDFFINNIEINKMVLDIGCGNGALSADIADKVDGIFVYGIDLVKSNIQIAESSYNRHNIKYVIGNALTDLPDEKFDIIILSNVLEHIEDRIEFLIKLINKYNPEKFLIRVPCFDRDWRVPLKKEIGIDYRLDNTHCIEYLFDDFKAEINKAGLFIESSVINWGEIWAVVKIQKNED